MKSLGLGCDCAMPMAGLGTLTIPDHWLWSASDVSSFYNIVLDAVSNLEQDITANVPHTTEGDALRTEYRAFKNDFLQSYQQHHEISLPVSSSGTAVNVAREAASRFNRFEERYRAITGHAPRASSLAPVRLEESPSPRIAGLPVWAWAGIGLVGLGLVGWITMSISRTAVRFSPAGLLMNPRRRRARRRR
jgi:hypothetical protein